MSGIKDLIQILAAGNSRHIPLRDLYYSTGHKQIARRLGKRADACIDDNSFWDSLSIATGQKNAVIEVPIAEKMAIIEDAEKSLNNIFNLLGSGEVKLNPIQWNMDFIHGYEWKKGTYYLKYNQVDLSNNADVKIPREISRCHHLLRLALAYRFTGEEKYAKTIINHIEDWINENPLMYSINWGCAMDVAIRAVNWIWALSLLENYKVEKRALNKIKVSLYQHGWFIYNNLEGNNYSYNNNHYFSDIVGLLHIAILFREDKAADQWLRFAILTFYRETRLQVLPSGMTFECSTNYSRLVLELVLTSVVYLKRNGVDVPPDIWQRLERMFEFTMKLTMPNGEMPIVGDQDNGRVLPWGIEDLNDHRYLLATGAILFNRGDFKQYDTGYNVYAAVFAGTQEEYNQINMTDSDVGSELIRDAGFALMRKGKNYLLFNADNQGMYRDTGTGLSHTHCDWFSFILCAKGVPFIIDPGSYVYSSDADARNVFRSTKMHNTLVVDDENQVRMEEKQLWYWNRSIIPHVLSWESDDHQDRIEAEIDAFSWLGDNIKHRRCVQYVKSDCVWTIRDEFQAAKNHNIRILFHLDEEVVPSVDGRCIILSSKGITLLMEIITESEFQIVIEDSLISKSYGHKIEAKTVSLSMENINNTELSTKIWVRKD